MEVNQILQGDCLDALKTLHDNSVDSIVTDPPYELGFMGKQWDSTGIAYNVDVWKECLRVLKQGGHLLSFGGTRTYHRMTCAIEDAGFEIRDQIQWIYGSGLPKSHNISKAIDKKFGAEREVIGRDEKAYRPNAEKAHQEGQIGNFGLKGDGSGLITAPATPEAQQWDGWGTCLKPANEPIVLARKPISEKTIAENVMKWGTGGINIDDCRVGTGEREQFVGKKIPKADTGAVCYQDYNYPKSTTPLPEGRFPANVILDEEAGILLDEQSDRASRFFYCAKASKKERGEGNKHPTVKPIKLMEYLITLITPPNGIVLDPFFGSGTTGIAAVNLGFNYIGIELEEQYVEIARRRIGSITEREGAKV